jgi:uncharacterized Fe-S cluster-containing protein
MSGVTKKSEIIKQLRANDLYDVQEGDSIETDYGMSSKGYIYNNGVDLPIKHDIEIIDDLMIVSETLTFCVHKKFKSLHTNIKSKDIKVRLVYNWENIKKDYEVHLIEDTLENVPKITKFNKDLNGGLVEFIRRATYQQKDASTE